MKREVIGSTLIRVVLMRALNINTTGSKELPSPVFTCHIHTSSTSNSLTNTDVVWECW